MDHSYFCVRYDKFWYFIKTIYEIQLLDFKRLHIYVSVYHVDFVYFYNYCRPRD